MTPEGHIWRLVTCFTAHPQTSLCAVGDRAEGFLAVQPRSYALGHGSPLSQLASMDAKILLVGVGYDRVSYLHHIESTIHPHRRKERRFPITDDGRRRWVAATDVADDNGVLFPAVKPPAGPATRSAQPRPRSSTCTRFTPCPPLARAPTPDARRRRRAQPPELTPPGDR